MAIIDNTVCVIPARGGSKGIPRKNIKIFNGKPLISYTIETALKSPSIDRVIVSTDDAEIAEIAKEFGAEVPFMRPAHLATDRSPTIETIRHAVSFLESEEKYYSFIAILEPTSPLRLVDDVEAGIQKIKEGRVDTVVGGKLLDIDFSDVMVENGEFISPFLDVDKLSFRRQDSVPVVMLNGSFYIVTRDVLFDPKTKIFNPYGENSYLKTKVILMPEERSIEIDGLVQFKLAELLLQDREAQTHEQS